MSTYRAPASDFPMGRRRARGTYFFLKILLLLVVVAPLGSLGLSFYVGWHLTHPTRMPITRTPALYHLAYRVVRFPSRVDKLQLHGWLIPASVPTRKIVIEAHGYRHNRSGEKPLLPVAKALHEAGFAVLMFDFRDEGNSPGREVTVGFYEIRDLLGAVDYARLLGFRHIGVYGLSMGASIALQATADDSEIQATVADSPFADLYSYLEANMPIWTHLPNWPFTSEILWELCVFEGLDSRKVDPLADLAHWRPRPLLLIAGTADHTVPVRNSRKLYQQVRSDSQDSLWLVPGAKHIGAYSIDPKAYEQRVVGFFNSYL